MARGWFRILAAMLGVCLIGMAAAPAWAQPKPPAPAEKPDLKPPTSPPYVEPVRSYIQVYCTDEEKAAGIKALEDGLAQAEKNLRDHDAWMSASADYIAAARAAGQTKAADDQAWKVGVMKPVRYHLVETVDWFKRMLAAAKTRKVVNCHDPKRLIPPAPPIETAQWQAGGPFCTQAEKDAWLKQLEEVQKILERNFYAAENHAEELRALIQEAKKPGSRFERVADELKAALENYKGVVAQEVEAYRDINIEVERARREPLKDCPPPRTSTGPQPPPPVEPGPPKTGDGPKPGPPPPEPPKPGIPKTGEGHGALPWTPHRPAFQPVGTPQLRGFCDEFARNSFLNGAMLPELDRANANVGAANTYLTGLNAEFAQANRSGAPVAQVVAIKQEIDAFGQVAQQQQTAAAGLQAEFQTALHSPLDPACPRRTATPSTPPTTPPSDGPLQPAGPPPVAPAPGPGDGPRPCHCLDRKPIEVGANNRVGSGARARDKAVSTAVGLVGGLLGGGGGGGGSDGPQLSVCRISDKEMSVFDDPATGISLKVGAKRAGDKVVVFADVAKSPDAGTFQAAWLQDGEGARQAPRDVGICELWGEWKLTVSWTRTTYVNDQVVSRESGGWSRAGEFRIPGTLSTAAAPDGLWKRMGFSNASHGARRIALTYDAPRAKLAAGPLGVMIHVTRPGQSPVTTTPFALMLRETPDGFVFERPPACLCDGGAVKGSFSEAVGLEAEVPAIDYRTGAEDMTRRKLPSLPKTTSKTEEPAKTATKPEPPKAADKPPEAPKTVSRAEPPPLPPETEAEFEARRTREEAAQDKRFAESAPRREAYDKRLDQLGKGSGPPGGSDYAKDSISLDGDGVPEGASINYFNRDFDLPLYVTEVNAAGEVTGAGTTDAYRAYMTMKAAVQGGLIYGAFSYGQGAHGRYVDHATVKDKDGHTRGEFTFHPDGTVKSGETFDPEGHRVGVINNP